MYNRRGYFLIDDWQSIFNTEVTVNKIFLTLAKIAGTLKTRFTKNDLIPITIIFNMTN